MLLFSTLLEINDTMTKDSFIQLVLEWNQGSAHEENIIQGIEWNGERNVRYGTETLWLAIDRDERRNGCLCSGEQNKGKSFCEQTGEFYESINPGTGR